MPPGSPRPVLPAGDPVKAQPLLAQELRQLDIEVEREHPAGVSFLGPLASGYRAAGEVIAVLPGTTRLIAPSISVGGHCVLPWLPCVA